MTVTMTMTVTMSMTMTITIDCRQREGRGHEALGRARGRESPKERASFTCMPRRSHFRISNRKNNTNITILQSQIAKSPDPLLADGGLTALSGLPPLSTSGSFDRRVPALYSSQIWLFASCASLWTHLMITFVSVWAAFNARSSIEDRFSDPLMVRTSVLSLSYTLRESVTTTPVLLTVSSGHRRSLYSNSDHWYFA